MASKRAQSARTAALSVVAPYTTRAERQNEWLQKCRQRLKPEHDFDSDNEFGLYGQGTAVICELAARERGLDDPPGFFRASEQKLDALMSRLVARLGDGVGLAGSYGVGRPACEPKNKKKKRKAGSRICFGNIVIARYAAFFAAYIFHRFPDVAWTAATRNRAHRFFAEGNWYPWTGNVGNSTLPLIAMRIFAGESFGDADLFEYGRSQLYEIRDHSVRTGLAEPMAPHYAGLTLNVLAMMTDSPNVEVKRISQDLMALSLLVPAHLYLPGGGLGAPQHREKSGGGIADPDPTAAHHLISALNLWIHDPELRRAGYPLYALGSNYQAPEIIRSIFLDKGDGYTFEYRDRSPATGDKSTGWYPGRRAFRSVDRGSVTHDRDGVRVNPWAAVMLPGGRAQMGLTYASGGRKSNSSGLYVRKPGAPRGGKHRDFSILYQHQPGPPAKRSRGRAHDPLKDDPTWRWERKAGARRMLYGRSAISLFDVNGGDFRYTMTHVPDFSDSAVGDGMQEISSKSLRGHSWFVGQSGNAYVAYLPLGTIVKRKQVRDAEGDWIYLKLLGAVSGGITELATTDDFSTLSDYAKDLAARHVGFRGTDVGSAWAEVDVHGPAGTKRIRLDVAGERRSIDGVLQADSDFLLLREVMRSPFVRWDAQKGALTVSRAGYPKLVLDFGDPRLPTAPHRGSVTYAGGVARLKWRHGYDDVGITAYDIYRDGKLLRSVDGRTTRFSDRPPKAADGRRPVYTLASRDADGNVSLMRSRAAETSSKKRRSR